MWENTAPFTLARSVFIDKRIQQDLWNTQLVIQKNEHVNVTNMWNIDVLSVSTKTDADLLRKPMSAEVMKT